MSTPSATVTRSDKCVVIGVHTFKGGTGKTTLMTQVASALAALKPDVENNVSMMPNNCVKTLVIDLDPQQNAATFFDEGDVSGIPGGDVNLTETTVEERVTVADSPSFSASAPQVPEIRLRNVVDHFIKKPIIDKRSIMNIEAYKESNRRGGVSEMVVKFSSLSEVDQLIDNTDSYIQSRDVPSLWVLPGGAGMQQMENLLTKDIIGAIDGNLRDVRTVSRLEYIIQRAVETHGFKFVFLDLSPTDTSTLNQVAFYSCDYIMSVLAPALYSGLAISTQLGKTYGDPIVGWLRKRELWIDKQNALTDLLPMERLQETAPVFLPVVYNGYKGDAVLSTHDTIMVASIEVLMDEFAAGRGHFKNKKRIALQLSPEGYKHILLVPIMQTIRELEEMGIPAFKASKKEYTEFYANCGKVLNPQSFMKDCKTLQERCTAYAEWLLDICLVKMGRARMAAPDPPAATRKPSTKQKVPETAATRKPSTKKKVPETAATRK
eukprot:CAMPEP_0181337662 /NCGR_PEP_ID=MMETSP1101-20121128/28153_1 /TAXON_ID=46948 /ORGANISM="Rhodomonas abbreviata, Strain Caron Lab Isolate" /LENGTH=491 /DNA_ID=CAMNT_0023448201 /DNA_START=9 /DNA_END=1481 /DNA_ORIENTATION=-